jgi:NAD(P)-dependent dehydrogenase (short-subunit alcohol dehydrogenase family)
MNKTIKELFDFKNKTVVITGSAKGIGFGIALRFIEAGANVVISDVDDACGEKKAKDLGKHCTYIHADVSSEEDVLQLVQKTTDKFGKIDVFINNAGIFPSSLVLEMKSDLWDKIQNINLRGTFLCSREAAKKMVQNGAGVIINIVSIDALHPSQVGLAGYDASKAGVWGFTKNFALEVASKNIRVNAIAPGGVSTEGVEEMTKGAIKTGDTQSKQIEQFVSGIPMKRMATPDEIATVALFLASDASKYMTGTMVVVDGGHLIS